MKKTIYSKTFPYNLYEELMRSGYYNEELRDITTEDGIIQFANSDTRYFPYLMDALHELEETKPRIADMIMMKYKEGYSIPKIADIRGLSVGRVYELLRKYIYYGYLCKIIDTIRKRENNTISSDDDISRLNLYRTHNDIMYSLNINTVGDLINWIKETKGYRFSSFFDRKLISVIFDILEKSNLMDDELRECKKNTTIISKNEKVTYLIDRKNIIRSIVFEHHIDTTNQLMDYIETNGFYFYGLNAIDCFYIFYKLQLNGLANDRIVENFMDITKLTTQEIAERTKKLMNR